MLIFYTLTMIIIDCYYFYFMYFPKQDTGQFVALYKSLRIVVFIDSATKKGCRDLHITTASFGMISFYSRFQRSHSLIVRIT